MDLILKLPKKQLKCCFYAKCLRSCLFCFWGVTPGCSGLTPASMLNMLCQGERMLAMTNMGACPLHCLQPSKIEYEKHWSIASGLVCGTVLISGLVYPRHFTFSTIMASLFLFSSCPIFVLNDIQMALMGARRVSLAGDFQCSAVPKSALG